MFSSAEIGGVGRSVGCEREEAGGSQSWEHGSHRDKQRLSQASASLLTCVVDKFAKIMINCICFSGHCPHLPDIVGGSTKVYKERIPVEIVEAVFLTDIHDDQLTASSTTSISVNIMLHDVTGHSGRTDRGVDAEAAEQLWPRCHICCFPMKKLSHMKFMH